MQVAEKAAIGVCVFLCVAGLGFFVSQKSGRKKIEPRASSSGGSAASGLGQIATISDGERIKIEDYLEPGTRTVIEFTADW